MTNALPRARYLDFHVEQSTLNEMVWNESDTFRNTVCSSFFKMVMISYYQTAKVC